MSEARVQSESGAMQESVIDSGWIRPEHREQHVGNIFDDRSLNQRIGDANWKPVMPSEPEHPHDAKIDSLEREVARKKRDEEFSKLRTTEERALYTLREQRESDFQAAEQKAAEKKWLKDQSEPLARLAEIRQAMAESDAGVFNIRDVVKIDQTRKQFSTFGADLKAANKMLSEVEQRFSAVIEQEQLRINAQLMGMQNKMDALKSKLRTTQQPEETESEFDAKLREAVEFQRTLRALEDAGRDDEAQQLVREAVAKREARKAGTANE
jgi:hypothetical protein